MTYHPCVCGHITLQHVNQKDGCKFCPCVKYRKQGRAQKYGARKTTVDGVTFASKKEADYYVKLRFAKMSGMLSYFLRQVPFHLPGGVKYVCDFAEFWHNGQVVFTDTKGFRTRDYITKRKMVEALYPVHINEV